MPEQSTTTAQRSETKLATRYPLASSNCSSDARSDRLANTEFGPCWPSSPSLAVDGEQVSCRGRCVQGRHHHNDDQPAHQPKCHLPSATAPSRIPFFLRQSIKRVQSTRRAPKNTLDPECFMFYYGNARRAPLAAGPAMTSMDVWQAISCMMMQQPAFINCITSILQSHQVLHKQSRSKEKGNQKAINRHPVSSTKYLCLSLYSAAHPQCNTARPSPLHDVPTASSPHYTLSSPAYVPLPCPALVPVHFPVPAP